MLDGGTLGTDVVETGNSSGGTYRNGIVSTIGLGSVVVTGSLGIGVAATAVEAFAVEAIDVEAFAAVGIDGLVGPATRYDGALLPGTGRNGFVTGTGNAPGVARLMAYHCADALAYSPVGAYGFAPGVVVPQPYQRYAGFPA